MVISTVFIRNVIKDKGDWVKSQSLLSFLPKTQCDEMNMGVFMSEDYPEQIVCAANKFIYTDEQGNEQEFIIAGVRHHACYYDPRAIELRLSGKPYDVIEGFYTNKINKSSKNKFPEYRFLDRVEAMKLFTEVKQKRRIHPSTSMGSSFLFSEDIY